MKVEIVYICRARAFMNIQRNVSKQSKFLCSKFTNYTWKKHFYASHLKVIIVNKKKRKTLVKAIQNFESIFCVVNCKVGYYLIRVEKEELVCIAAAEAEHGYAAVSLPNSLMFESMMDSAYSSSASSTSSGVQTPPIAFNGKFNQNNNSAVILSSSAPSSMASHRLLTSYEDSAGKGGAASRINNNASKRLGKMSNRKPQGNR